MHERKAEQTGSMSPATEVELPLCCGTGCAVCVLDDSDAYANEIAETGTRETAAATPFPVQERMQCCNTGCLICVRDYPELLVQTEPEIQALALLEAIEQAQQQAAQALAQTHHETR